MCDIPNDLGVDTRNYDVGYSMWLWESRELIEWGFPYLHQAIYAGN